MSVIGATGGLPLSHAEVMTPTRVIWSVTEAGACGALWSQAFGLEIESKRLTRALQREVKAWVGGFVHM